MRTKFRTIIPILIAVITAISVIPAYAEVIFYSPCLLRSVLHFCCFFGVQ